ncbi:MAG: regulatory protein [Candidatus Berkelbacteria bacterium Licking1014_96]|uniref:Regulatory protein RecX n=1 Tax=Candidatus Berkelbacteria bacterium Licking1014_96 TaxID=2017149 RepID=A0A554LEZ8_9BACT|nr:MAG: regulatory protein [Candidatus Berkelbacteria bacterium Licking1014_96]
MKKKLEKNQYEQVLNKAFVYLARRNHSEQELKTKLQRKFFQEAQIKKVITRLKKLGYLDDEKFAREWIEYRLGRHPRGRVLIKRELQVKGVEVELVEKMLELVYNGDREKKELTRLLGQRADKYPRTRKGKHQLISYLLRRGFLWEDIKESMESEEELKIYK